MQRLGTAIFVCLALAPGQILADSANQQTGCGAKVQRIADCNRLIRSGRFERRDLAVLYWSRGNAWARQMKFSRAVVDFNRAIEADRTFAYAYFARGLVYQYALKRMDLAYRDFRTALALRPWDRRFADKLLSLGYLVPLRPRI